MKFWYRLFGGQANVTAVSTVTWSSDSPNDYRCMNANLRHLYLGAEFCKRGCGHRNPKFKGGDAA